MSALVSLHTPVTAMANRQDYTELFRDARTGFTNARNEAELLAALTPFGWDDARLREALELLGRAEREARDQTTEYAEQRAATKALGVAQATVGAAYARHVAIARTLYRPGDAAYETLGLGGERPARPDALVQEARRFYEAVGGDAAIQARLATRTLDAAAVEAAVELLEAVDAAEEAQEKEKGEAQRATEVRDETVTGEDGLEGVYRDFAAVARIALADQPQLREKLGIFERS
jgi:hypothetical protein